MMKDRNISANRWGNISKNGEKMRMLMNAHMHRSWDIDGDTPNWSKHGKWDVSAGYRLFTLWSFFTLL